MDKIYFDYEGSIYSGYLMQDPAGGEYIWFVFNDDEMTNLFGDSVAFTFDGGSLVPVYQYTNKASFIEDLRKIVEAEYHLKKHHRAEQ